MTYFLTFTTITPTCSITITIFAVTIH